EQRIERKSRSDERHVVLAHFGFDAHRDIEPTALRNITGSLGVPAMRLFEMLIPAVDACRHVNSPCARLMERQRGDLYLVPACKRERLRVSASPRLRERIFRPLPLRALRASRESSRTTAA